MLRLQQLPEAILHLDQLGVALDTLDDFAEASDQLGEGGVGPRSS
jgi:hypothetical protein